MWTELVILPFRVMNMNKQIGGSKMHVSNKSIDLFILKGKNSSLNIMLKSS